MPTTMDINDLELSVFDKTNRMSDRARKARKTAKKARKAGNLKKWDKFNAVARVWEMAIDEIEAIIPEF